MRALPIPLVIASVIAACGNEPAKDPPSPAPPLPAAPPGSVQLVAAGEPPLAPLRYRLAAGTTTRLELVLDLDLDAGGQGGPLPRVVMTTELAIGDVLPDGGAKLRATIVDLATQDREGSPLSAAQLGDSMQLMRGLVLTGTLSPSGGLRDMTTESAAHALPPALASQLANLSHSIEQIAMPLPDAPVGVGASWRQEKTFEQGGMTMTTHTTVTLVSRQGDTFGFTTTSEVAGKDQTVTQHGTTIRVANIHGTASGRGTLDLARLALTSELTSELSSEMSAQDQTTRMRMRMTTHIRPARPPAPDSRPEEASADPEHGNSER